MHISQTVLDGLVATDHPAELGALFGVVHRGVQHRLARTDQLRGGRQCAVLVGQCGVGRPGLPGGRHREQSSGRIHRLMLLADDRIADRPVLCQQHQSGEVGIDRSRHRRRHRDRRDQLAGHQLGRPVIAGKENRRHRDRFGDRSRYAPATQPLARHDDIHRVGPQAVVLLRHCQCGHAQIGQSRPDLASRCAVPIRPGSNRARHIRGPECRVDTGREIALLGIECEFHERFTPELSLGRPNSRSAMMLR